MAGNLLRRVGVYALEGTTSLSCFTDSTVTAATMVMQDLALRHKKAECDGSKPHSGPIFCGSLTNRTLSLSSFLAFITQPIQTT